MPSLIWDLLFNLHHCLHLILRSSHSQFLVVFQKVLLFQLHAAHFLKPSLLISFTLLAWLILSYFIWLINIYPLKCQEIILDLFCWFLLHLELNLIISLMLKCNSTPGLPWWLSVKNLPAMLETQVWSLGQEEPPGEGNDNPFQYSCLENPINRRAWQATVHGVAKSWTQCSNSTTTTNYVPSRLWTTQETKLNFLGGPVVKNLPANVGYMGLIPGSMKISHATEQLISLCATTVELMSHYWSPCTLESMFHKRAAPTCHN